MSSLDLLRSGSETSLDDPPPNDICEQSISVAINASVQGTTIEATIDAPPLMDSCGVLISVPGVWYTVVGSGAELTASVCQADYDTKLSVFCGDCSSLYCVGGNDDFCGLQSLFRWCSSENQTYMILVHGYGGQTGNFTLVVNEGAVCDDPPLCDEAPVNISCETAEPLDLLTVAGSTRGAVQDWVPDCSNYNLNHGVWYQLVADGTTLTASTCDPATDPNFDSVLEVFCGSCDELVCVASNDNDFTCSPYYLSTVSWCTEAGRTYWIRVSSFQNPGDFQLTVSSDNTPCDDPVPCFSDCAPSTDVITFDSFQSDPQYHCVFICPNTPIEIEVYPIYHGINLPVLMVSAGCDVGCEITGLSPTTPMVDLWWYDEPALTWRTQLSPAAGQDSGWVCVSLDQILDVNLLAFAAASAGGEIRLEWQTGSELSNDHFEIRREQELIGTLPGSGTTSTSHSYRWTDRNISAWRSYSYELYSVSVFGTRELIGSVEAQAAGNSTIEDYELLQNYPNPFNPDTRIDFVLKNSEHVLLSVYNPLGQLIDVIVDEDMSWGRHSITFNGDKLPAGMYFYQITTNSFKDTKKMILLK